MVAPKNWIGIFRSCSNLAGRLCANLDIRKAWVIPKNGDMVTQRESLNWFSTLVFLHLPGLWLLVCFTHCSNILPMRSLASWSTGFEVPWKSLSVLFFIHSLPRLNVLFTQFSESSSGPSSCNPESVIAPSQLQYHHWLCIQCTSHFLTQHLFSYVFPSSAILTYIGLCFWFWYKPLISCLNEAGSSGANIWKHNGR